MIPLSTKMRPRHIDDFVGQEHFLYTGSLFYNSIIKGNFTSAIFYGPSGCGKTTLARIIANTIDNNFIELHGAKSGTKELKDVIKRARESFYGIEGRPICLYVDEIHRWNKLQQDGLLEAIEEGLIRFIGSTTENPYFAINNALLSRVSNIYEFKNLDEKHIEKILYRAIENKEVGLGDLNIKYQDIAIKLLASKAMGDARWALDTLGFVVGNMQESSGVTEELVLEAIQQKAPFFHKKEDGYDLYSALQKSIRGSDADGSIYYFARMVDGGMDLKSICRRLLVIASEDISLAYPQAITIVNSCVSAAEKVGFPEAEIILAEAVILLAASPKSNSTYKALLAAKEDVRRYKDLDIPKHIRDAHYKGAKARGYGIGYKYPHDFGGFVRQQYLPDKLYDLNKKYYLPTENGGEKNFKTYLKTIYKKEDKK